MKNNHVASGSVVLAYKLHLIQLL